MSQRATGESEGMRERVGFPEIVSHFWARRRMLVYFVIVAAVAGVGMALTLKPRYRASVVLMPAEMPEARGVGDSLGGRLSDLADIAGLGGQSSDDLEKSIAILVSRNFTVRFLREEGALPVLFSDRWDEKRGTWKREAAPGAAGRLLGALLRVLRSGPPGGANAPGADANGAPSSWEAFKVFDRMRTVNRDKKAGLITVSVTWRDPQQAAQWANRLVFRVNEMLRARAIEDAEQSMEYLSEQLQKTSQVDMRDALFRLSEAEQRKALLAHVRHDYAFEVIDPAVPPRDKSSPSRVLFVLGFVIFGFLLGVATVLTQSVWIGRKSKGGQWHARNAD